jgi:hypothetical protein|tara:strand:+ start:7123 stop:8388 length:1266 start_codon:yes stop_codon:yes gene_type:complete
MSQNLEKLFKESLQNMDAPYNPQAWDALQARLDAAMPVATPKKPFNPWRASAIVIGVVGISTALYFLNSSDKVIKTSEVKVENQNSTKEKVAVKNNNTEQKAISENSVAKTIANETEPAVKTNSSTTNTQAQPQNSTNIIQGTIGELKTNVASTINNGLVETKRNENIEAIVLPLISKHCLNDEVIINNTNARNIVLTAPSGKKQIVAANKIGAIQLNEAGTYHLTDSNKEVENTFVVYSISEPYFDVDMDNIYKNGVPSTIVKTTSIANNFKWTYDKSKNVLSGKENEFHFFTKGNHTITLETTDNNGCKNSTSKTVNVDEDYNLMAVDAFSPLSNDVRKNTFMPFALKERNTGFSLTIIDPKTGGTVFTTKSAAEGWDGIDRRSGNLADNGANYIWKVVLTNPLPGEADSYKGIVIVTR